MAAKPHPHGDIRPIIAMAIIDEITDDGLLGTTLEEICETLARNHEGNDSPPELEEVERFCAVFRSSIPPALVHETSGNVCSYSLSN